MGNRSAHRTLYENLARLGHRVIDQTRFVTDKRYREKVVLERARQILKDNWSRMSVEISESREMVQLLWRYSRGERLTRREMTVMKAQILDLIRVVPALGVFALPGGLILLPILAKAFPWGLVPSAWRGARSSAPAGEEREKPRPESPSRPVERP